MTAWLYVAGGYLALLRFPWVYLAFAALVFFQVLRSRRLERASFGMRIVPALRGALLSIGLGFAAALFSDALLLALGARFDALDIWGVVVLTAVLAAVDIRWACVSYSGSIVAFVSAVAALFLQSGRISGVLAPLAGIHSFSLLLVVGVLHLAEGLLTGLSGATGSLPLLVESRRGHIVGAYLLGRIWPVPLVVLAGAHAAAFPVLTGFDGMAFATQPDRVARRAGAWIFAYGAFVTGIAFLTRAHPLWTALAALVAGTAHEAIHRSLRSRERKSPPAFARPARGVRALAMIPGSPADKLGLKAGEIIVQVNGLAVNSPYDVHFAIGRNPAYAKAEIIDSAGESRFSGTPLYEADPHQLGAVFVPDEGARAYARVHGPEAGRWQWQWWRARSRPDGRTAGESARG